MIKAGFRKASQQDQKDRGQDAEHYTGGDPAGGGLIVFQKRDRLLHGNTSDRLFEAVVHRSQFHGRFFFDLILDQVIGADAEDFRELQDLLHIRDCLGALPLGY